ncbi:MAG: helix-turn-helix domain-containing protein [Chloroflexota bacterium]|nr:helix-turn-helix domain-containing protein [Chloroflexota bacterium]
MVKLPPENIELMEFVEVCKLLHTSRTQVYRLIDQGRLHPYRMLSRRPLFDREEVQRVIDYGYIERRPPRTINTMIERMDANIDMGIKTTRRKYQRKPKSIGERREAAIKVVRKNKSQY